MHSFGLYEVTAITSKANTILEIMIPCIMVEEGCACHAMRLPAVSVWPRTLLGIRAKFKSPINQTCKARGQRIQGRKPVDKAKRTVENYSGGKLFCRSSHSRHLTMRAQIAELENYLIKQILGIPQKFQQYHTIKQAYIARSRSLNP